MANIIVKLKNKTKQFVYDEIENDIVISNITIIDEDRVNMDIQYEQNTIAKTYSFILNDYFGIPVLNNMTNDDYSDIKYQSYIQEVFEELAEMHNFWKN
jgi:hypothetical protein